MRYTKPSLPVNAQVDLLRARGMVIDDQERAARYLSHISYFRLRGYWIPFELWEMADGEHRFRPGTTFNDVLNLYVFDRKFRLLVLEAIERLEISFRSNFANELGIRYGSHFYLNPAHFHSRATHEQLLHSLEQEVGRSKETFIEHYRVTYSQPILPPIWAVSEVMSFGQLSHWYKNLKNRSDRQVLARVYTLDEAILQSFMHHLTHVRNITAHHGRLWNRRMVITMALPRQPQALACMFNPKRDRYIANTLIMIGYLIKLISPGSTWPYRLRQLIEESPQTDPSAMGFATDWRELPLWRDQG